MRSGFKMAIFTPILIAVVFALIIAADFMPSGALGIDENPYLAVVIIQLLTYAIPSLFYCRIRGKEFTPRLRLRLFKPARLLYLFYATVFMVAGVALLSVLCYTVSPAAFSSAGAVSNAAFAMNGGFTSGAYIIVAFAILPAITEEFLFRGIVVGEYEQNGAIIASVMSAIMFAMAHFSLVRLPIYLFSGLVLAAVTYATRSVVASMIVHAINNAVVLMTERYVLHIVDKQNVSLVLFLVILGLVIMLFGMLMCFEAHSIYRVYAETNAPSDYAMRKKQSGISRVAQSFFSPTFLIIVIIYIVVVLLKS
ncbi:MAG: CPBP family intramembrane metalloprotease [Clostridia bacterium]|nr:CPBP family intramembrane metalloprotease [Clostridia bacterium]